MAQKIMIVNGAVRRAGNTAFIVRQIAAGAEAAGHEVALVELAPLKGFGQGCISCFGCQRSDKFRCVLADEVSPVLEALGNYDRIVLAAPIYFFSAASQLKAFMDRFYCQVKYDGDKLVSPLAKVAFDVVATAGAGRDDSGVQTFLDTVRGVAGFLGCPEPRLFFAGNCGESVEPLKDDAAVAAAAVEFGKNL